MLFRILAIEYLTSRILMDKAGIEISWATLWRVFALIIFIGVLYLALDLWVGILLAIVISSAIDPLVSWLEKRRIPRALGSLGIFIVMLVLIAFLIYTIVPLALAELNILLKTVGKSDIPVFGFQEASKALTSVSDSLGRVATLLLGGNVSFFDSISKLLGSITIFFSVFMLTFYLTVDRDGVEKFLRAALPSGSEENVLDIYFRTRKKIGRWLYGQVFLSLSVGFAVFVGLWIIGVKYSILLGVLAGVLEIVPFVGPIVTGILAFLIALPQSFSVALYVVLMFTLIQQVEGSLLTPVFMKFATSLHPAVVLVSLLIGGRLLGIIGIIIAVPLAVAVQEIMETWSQEKLRRKGLGV